MRFFKFWLSYLWFLWCYTIWFTWSFLSLPPRYFMMTFAMFMAAMERHYGILPDIADQPQVSNRVGGQMWGLVRLEDKKGGPFHIKYFASANLNKIHNVASWDPSDVISIIRTLAPGCFGRTPFTPFIGWPKNLILTYEGCEGCTA